MLRVIKNEFQEHSSLKSQLLEVVNSSYTAAEQSVNSSLSTAEWLYLLEDESPSPRIDGFFFVHGIRELRAGNKTWASMYLGFSALRIDLHGTKAMDPLYDKFIEDASALERGKGQPLLLWLTTANPAVYRLVQKKLSDVRPRREWSLSSDDRDVFKALREYLKISNSDDSEANPFLLKSFSRGPAYTATLLNTIDEMASNAKLSYLKDLGIEARNGDRLLVICHLHSRKESGLMIGKNKVLGFMGLLLCGVGIGSLCWGFIPAVIVIIIADQ